MRRLTHLILTAALVSAVVPAVAWGLDLRSPDARDSARHVEALLSGRSANGRSFSAGRSEANDLRSPDARDAARRAVVLTPPPSSYAVPAVAPHEPVVHTTSQGFKWGDAGIGAAGMLAIVAIAAGAGLIVAQRRRHRRVPVATS
jgi:hypothetical protein